MNLNRMNVKSLETNEASKISGGNWIRWTVTLLGAMINDAQNNPNDFKAGMSVWD